jgi:hypothetical protein
MTFTPHAELPGFPTHTFDVMHKEHYYFKSATGRSTRECELTLQFRTVPGQTVATVEQDLKRLLGRIKQEHPAFNCTLEIPARGTERTWNQLAMRMTRAQERGVSRQPLTRRSTGGAIGHETAHSADWHAADKGALTATARPTFCGATAGGRSAA